MYCAYDENVVHLLLNSSINWLYSDRFRYSPRRDECPYWRPGTLACEKSARVYTQEKEKKNKNEKAVTWRTSVSECVYESAALRRGSVVKRPWRHGCLDLLSIFCWKEMAPASRSRVHSFYITSRYYILQQMMYRIKPPTCMYT
jgi:hypothetical protein